MMQKKWKLRIIGNAEFYRGKVRMMFKGKKGEKLMIYI
jgi:hypothetical protein